MTHRVVFTPEAEDQLNDLYRYIAQAATPDTAAGHVDAVITYCEGLAEFPHRGLARDDIRPGLRTTSYRKRTVVAFAVLDDVVAIIGIFHGGRDYEAILRETDHGARALDRQDPRAVSRGGRSHVPKSSTRETPATACYADAVASGTPLGACSLEEM